MKTAPFQFHWLSVQHEALVYVEGDRANTKLCLNAIDWLRDEINFRDGGVQNRRIGGPEFGRFDVGFLLKYMTRSLRRSTCRFCARNFISVMVYQPSY